MLNSIMIVGEAFGEKEEQEGRPLVGPSGYILNSMLAQVGIRREDCYATNVFNLRPKPTNDISNLCGPKAEALPGYGAVTPGKYIRKEYGPELSRLFAEINRVKPNLILAMGATAAWALLATNGIRKIRGAPLYTSGPAEAACGRVKVLPTYHPAAVMREYKLRPVVLADLDKAKREQHYPDIRRPQRFIHVEPTLSDMEDFYRDYIVRSPDLSIDIETAAGQITCIGFAPSIDRALVVPFIDPTKLDGNYWRTLEEEMKAWRLVRRWCKLQKSVVGQNFLYDSHYLWRTYGITVPHMEDDTMLLHHSLQPEMEKGLGFLGTVYTDEASWKFMRAKHETLKKED